ncbi:hypothetical protein [Sinomonas sp. P10A9]|uniref:Uncharacterized protein n=1 Tax=Sinomonas puerhi TaxID=3238584 RepID=A0AB39L000_9MICC
MKDESQIVMHNLHQYGIPTGAEGLALALTWFEGQKVAALMDPAAAQMALAAHRMGDGDTVRTDGSLVNWVALGWPEDWPDGRAPQWAAVYPVRGNR